MMFEQLRKKLDSSWIRKNEPWDIVVYGSYARGGSETRDIDLAIILRKPTPVKTKMALCQELRRMLAGAGYSLDVKAVDINDFLNPGFLGREAILAEGRSLLKKDYLAERFGFQAVALAQYSFKGLSASRQKMFYYALQGRKKGTGLLAKMNGKIVSKGLLQVPVRHYEEIRSLIEQHKLHCTTTFALQYRILH